MVERFAYFLPLRYKGLRLFVDAGVGKALPYVLNRLL